MRAQGGFLSLSVVILLPGRGHGGVGASLPSAGNIDCPSVEGLTAKETTMAKTRIMAASILLVAMFVNTVAFGDDNVWRGVNTAAFYDYTQTPVTNWVKTDYRLANAARASDGYGLWSRGTAPGTGDTAVFQWDTTQTSVWGYAEADVLITNGFAPDHIVLRCTSTTYPDNANEAQISTSGEVSAQTLTIDFTASGSTAAMEKTFSTFQTAFSGSRVQRIPSSSRERRALGRTSMSGRPRSFRSMRRNRALVRSDGSGTAGTAR